MAAVTFSDPTLTARSSTGRAANVEELRSAIDSTYDLLGRARPSFTDEPIVTGVTVIKRVHITELRAALRMLE